MTSDIEMKERETELCFLVDTSGWFRMVFESPLREFERYSRLRHPINHFLINIYLLEPFLKCKRKRKEE